MADYVTERDVSGVKLLTIELSEDEITVYLTALNTLLAQNDDETLESICGALRDEVEGMRDDLAALLDRVQAEPVTRMG